MNEALFMFYVVINGDQKMICFFFPLQSYITAQEPIASPPQMSTVVPRHA